MKYCPKVHSGFSVSVYSTQKKKFKLMKHSEKNINPIYPDILPFFYPHVP